MSTEAYLLVIVGVTMLFMGIFVLRDNRATYWDSWGEHQTWNNGRSSINYSWEELEAKKKALRGE